MSTTTLNLIICGFILFLAAIAYSVTTFYRRAVQDTPEGYPRGRVAGKTREQRNNLIIMLVPWLVIILPGTYFLYQYFQYLPILCPPGLIVLGWLGMAGFIFRNYLTAATMDRRGVSNPWIPSAARSKPGPRRHSPGGS